MEAHVRGPRVGLQRPLESISSHVLGVPEGCQHLQPPKEKELEHWCKPLASTDRILRYPMAILCTPGPVSLREGGPPQQSQPLHFFPGPLIPKPVPGSKRYPSASKPLLTGQGNRLWKLCVSDERAVVGISALFPPGCKAKVQALPQSGPLFPHLEKGKSWTGESPGSLPVLLCLI